jgi:predicted small lipoprotein YifL
MIPVATVLALSAAVMLSGCGRKGPLEPPPGDAMLQNQPAAPAADQGSILFPDADQGKPVAPAGQRRRIPLDVLID